MDVFRRHKKGRCSWRLCSATLFPERRLKPVSLPAFRVRIVALSVKAKLGGDGGGGALFHMKRIRDRFAL